MEEEEIKKTNLTFDTINKYTVTLLTPGFEVIRRGFILKSSHQVTHGL